METLKIYDFYEIPVETQKEYVPSTTMGLTQSL
jgi:hypothetical protein